MLHLPISDYVSRDVVTATPEINVLYALELMNESKVTSIIICDEKGCPVGIITTRDVLALLQHENADLYLPASEIMTRELVTCTDQITLLDTFDLMINHGIRHIPVVDHDNRLAGIISETDIMSSMGSIDLMRMQTAAEIMHTPVSTISASTHLSKVIGILNDDHIGSVVVAEDNKPIGIITERDLPSLIGQGLSGKTPAESVMSKPVIAIHGHATSQETLMKMQSHGIHHLVVTGENDTIQGIISRSSFFHNLTRYLIRQLVESESKLKKLLGKSEHEILQQQLIDIGNLYFSAVQNSPHGIIIEQRGKVVYANKIISALLGIDKPQALVGRSFLMLMHPEDRKESSARTNSSHESHGNAVFITQRMLKSDGDDLSVETSYTHIPYDGEPSTMVTVKDLTEKLILEERLQQAQKLEAMGILVGGIAHDFNNLLAGITGNVFLAQMAVEDNMSPSENLEQIEDLSFHAAEMIQQLLQFARKTRISMKPIELSGFIKEALDLHQITIPEHINVNLDISDEPLTIHGDFIQLQRSLINLIRNAADALEGKENPTITISLHKKNSDNAFLERHPSVKTTNMVRLTVHDNGSGISEGTQEHLFEPFFTTKDVGKGTGLGLAVVYGTLRAHGGVIEVESRQNAFTAFHLYFPLSDNKSSEKKNGLSKDVMMGSGESILLVDDQSFMLQTGKGILERLGYRAITAKGGEEAIKIYQEQKEEIKLIILDVVMPEMDGKEVSEALLSINPNANILFATGYNKNEILPSEIDEKGQLILKPFSVPELSKMIRNKLDMP